MILSPDHEWKRSSSTTCHQHVMLISLDLSAMGAGGGAVITLLLLSQRNPRKIPKSVGVSMVSGAGSAAVVVMAYPWTWFCGDHPELSLPAWESESHQMSLPGGLWKTLPFSSSPSPAAVLQQLGITCRHLQRSKQGGPCAGEEQRAAQGTASAWPFSSWPLGCVGFWFSFCSSWSFLVLFGPFFFFGIYLFYFILFIYLTSELFGLFFCFSFCSSWSFLVIFGPFVFCGI